uniref:G-protein coupled receptors family 1 profile domain-containing protein n=1 Tax=Romanomermis culicivorax TaxID=13658 RepID=A0A915HTF2_ROMCU
MTKFFEVETDVNEECMDRFGAYALKRTTLQQDELYSTVYSLWMTQFVMVFAPFLALTIFNTIIAFTIRKTFKRLSWVQKGKKRDELKDKSREANYVLVVIVLIFLICNSWGFVLAVMERMMGDEYLYRNMTDFYVFSREAINFLTIINSSINFIHTSVTNLCYQFRFMRSIALWSSS